MKTSPYIYAGALLALLLGPAGGRAEDVDIYSSGSGTTTVPNVLIVLDNAAAFSANAPGCTYMDGTTPSLNGTAGGIEQCALYNVISQLQPNTDGTARINLGFMVYNANRFTPYGCDGGGNGGCVIQPLTPMTAASKTALMNWITSWTTSGNDQYNIKANGEATGATMQETWAYFSGHTGLSGTSYGSAVAGCQNFVIFIGNAFGSNGTPSDGGSTDPSRGYSPTGIISIPSGSYGTASFSCGNYTMPNHTSSSGLYADEWARYMYGTDNSTTLTGTQNVITYTIGLLGTSCKPDYPALMASMARVGGGKYFATSSYNEIYQAILKILNEVQAVNSVFASSSLPVSVNTQGTYLNQVYMGMFRPDAHGEPRWTGNLKQYQFVFDPTAQTLSLADSLGQPMISASTGFITPSAVSFWTVKDTSASPDSTGGFWINNPQGAGGGYDSPDGEVVEKGGAGQHLRLANLTDDYAANPSSPRNVYTYCPSGSNCNAALSDASNAFATTNAANINLGTASQFTTSLTVTTGTTPVMVTASSNNSLSPGDPVTITGCSGTLATSVNGATVVVTSATSTSFQFPSNVSSGSATNCTITPKTTKTALINWMRGQDNNSPSDESGPGGGITIRPSVHGDVVHSRPAAINYGGSTGVVVFYGGNDGVYRAINGNQTGSIGSTPPGGELWGFIPPEYFGKLKRLRNDSPAQLMPSTLSGILPTPQRKDYFADGSTGVYQNGSTVYVYMAQRRGGRFIYALDASNPTAPQFLWKKGCYPDGTCDTGFGEIGQTWSQPKTALLRGYTDGSGNPKPVLIFGAGYDAAAEDREPPTADAMGRGIFILDAADGHIVWQAQPQPSGSTACSGTAPTVCSVAGMNYSIPADITLLDRNYDGYIDRLYAADVGGNIWRVDLEPTAGNTPDQWTVTKLAALGCGSGPCSAGSTPRKFLFPPDVVPTASYDAVLAGSGDREHPLYSTSDSSACEKTNRFYMLKDTNTGNDGSNLNIVQSSLVDATSTLYTGSGSGYYISLANCEKVVNAPLTVAGYTYFGTNQPSAPATNSCTSNLGTARGYAVRFNNGVRNVTTFTGGGLPPSPIAGLVNVSVNGTNKLVPFLIGGGAGPGTQGGDGGGSGSGGCAGADCSSPFGAQKPVITPGTSRKRTYWYQELDK
jgi:type IV pilus assembly protein PilY1